MDDLYANVCSTSMPDLVLNTLCELTKLSVEELASTAIPSLLKNYGRKMNSFVQQSHPGVRCSRFDVFNWDHHLKEELFYALLSIPIEMLTIETHPAELLVTVGWTVLVVYPYDHNLNSTWLISIVRELLKLNGTNEKANYFLNKLWDVEYCEFVPQSLLGDVAVTSPFVIERLVADLMEDLTKTPIATLTSHIRDDLFLKSNVNCWLKLCATSPKVFQFSVAIINSFLLYSRGERFVATFVQEFHRAVNKFCEGKIVSLYPLHLQKLATFLNITPSLFNPVGESRDITIKTVLEPILDGLMFNRNEYLCLLSHFPEWIPYLLQYGIEIGEARTISKKLFALDF